MINIKNLKKQIKNQQYLCIDELNLKKGNVYSILGHNGSGKSTLIKILYKIENFESGSITIDNIDVKKDVYKFIAYCPQESRFLSGTLEENIKCVYKYSESNDLLDKDKVYELLKEFDLIEKLQTKVNNLSGGEKAKLQFIRTLMFNKDYYIFDEPMANMDTKTIKKVEEKLINLKSQGKTIILITHDIMQAKRISDYIIFMENLQCIGTFSCKKFFSELYKIV